MAKRRARGDGGLYQRADGYWVGATTVGGKKRVVYGKTQTEARTRLQALKDEIAKGVVPTNETVAAYLNRWLEIAAKPAVRPGTYDCYEAVVRLHLNPRFQQTVTKLTPMDVQAVLAEAEKAGIAPRTRQLMFAVLRRAFNQAVKWRVVAISPVEGTVPPKYVPKKWLPWTAEQGRAFLGATATSIRYPLYVLALTTSMRLSEMLGLTWDRVDLTTGLIVVDRQLSRDEKSTADLKTPQSKLNIVLPPVALKALKTLRLKSKPGVAWVFAGRKDKPFSRKAASKVFKAVVRKAGLPVIRFHDLRHTAITLQLADGAPVKDVSARVGHHKASMTLDIYGHVLPGADAKSAARMESLLGGGAS